MHDWGRESMCASQQQRVRGRKIIIFSCYRTNRPWDVLKNQYCLAAPLPRYMLCLQVFLSCILLMKLEEKRTTHSARVVPSQHGGHRLMQSRCHANYKALDITVAKAYMICRARWRQLFKYEKRIYPDDEIL